METEHTPFFAPTRAGKGLGLLATHALATNFTAIDPKGSAYAMSKAKAKKRLMAAGLSPAEANALVRRIAGHGYKGYELQAAMRNHKRHGKKWFPWDSLIRNS